MVHMFSLLMIFFGIMTFKQSTASEPCVTVAGTTAPWETLSAVLKMADYLEKHNQLLVSMVFLLLQAFKTGVLQQLLSEQEARNSVVIFLNSRLLTLKREWDTVQVNILHGALVFWYLSDTLNCHNTSGFLMLIFMHSPITAIFWET